MLDSDGESGSLEDLMLSPVDLRKALEPSAMRFDAWFCMNMLVKCKTEE